MKPLRYTQDCIVLSYYNFNIKQSSYWNLHERTINSIDFNSENFNIMAISSSDGTACIWDLRSTQTSKGI